MSRTPDSQAEFDLRPGHLCPNPPFPPPSNPLFDFADLFAGIGGFRIALGQLGGRCTYSSEWDRFAQITYAHNYGEWPHGDIALEENKKAVPQNLDILCGGFPCQSFSIAGLKQGFEDTRGTMFFHIAEIIKAKQPKAVLLENVKGLRSHDRGRTLAIMLGILTSELGYIVPEPRVFNARDFGLAQNRERIFIVAFRQDQNGHQFRYPDVPHLNACVGDIREKEPVPARYYLSDQGLASYLKQLEPTDKPRKKLYDKVLLSDSDTTHALTASHARDKHILFDPQLCDMAGAVVPRHGLRNLTPRECARLQGFPEAFQIPVSNSQAYKQFGNAVPVPLVQAVAREVLACINPSPHL